MRKQVFHLRLTVPILVAFFTLTVIATVARAAIISGVDSIYPTLNTPWLCTGSSTPGGSYYCQTDNSTLTFGMESSFSSSQKTVIRYMVSSQYEPTDLTTTEHTSIAYTGSSETDIVYQVGDPGLPYNGITWCDDAVSTTLCDQHYVIIISTRITSSASTPCHETGHAVGLTHGSNAYPSVSDDNVNLECMRTPGTSVTSLGAHNVYQVNSVY